MTTNEANYLYYLAVGQETGKDIVPKVYEIQEDEKGKKTYPIRLNTYYSNGLTYMTLSPDQYKAIQDW